MSSDNVKLMLEFTDAKDSRKKDSLAERIDTNEAIPIPAIGDTVYLSMEKPAKLLRVERRMITYADGYTHVQCFCREISESEI